METYQIIITAFILLAAILKIKKSFASRSLTNYSASEVKQMMKEGNNIVLLDVRTGHERKMGSIKGSIHVPLHEIASRPDLFNGYKSHEIICYCQSGSRSVSAALKLKKLGFNSANMTGGYGSW